MFHLLNQERAKRGLPALQQDRRLAEAARSHSALMAEQKQLSHQLAGEETLPVRLARTHLRLSRDAENVAYNTGAEGAHEGFMQSPGHRANMLSPQYNAAGIGVVRAEGMLWVTEDFAYVLPNMSEEQVEEEIAGSFIRLRKSPGIPHARSVRLQKLACEMARSDNLNTSRVLDLSDVRYAVAYVSPEPADLPSGARKLRDNADIRRFEVGVCFAASPRNPLGTYWVLMAFY